MKKFIVFLCFCFIFELVCSQNVSNLDFYMQDDNIVVTYDLDMDADIYLFASVNEKDGWNTSFMNWSSYLREAPALRAVSGDVGRSVKKGVGRKIIWNIKNEVPSFFADKTEEGLASFVIHDSDGEKSYTATTILEVLQMKIEAYPPTCEPELVWIDGCDGSGNFWIGKYEVTIAEFAYFVRETGYKTTAEKQGWAEIWDRGKNGWAKKRGVSWKCDEEGNERPISDYSKYPVVNVSYYDAVAYCEWLSKRYNKNYNLPLDRHWIVVAAEVNTCWGVMALPGKYQYSGSDRIDDVGWCNWNSNNTIQPIGLKKSNIYKVHDMSGNVYEWVYGIFDEEGNSIENKSELNNTYISYGMGGSCFEAPARLSEENNYSLLYWKSNVTGVNIGFRVIMWVNENQGQSWKNWKITK